MLFSDFILPVVGLLAAGVTARPTLEGIEARQLTSPSVLQTVNFDIDVAVDAHAKSTDIIANILGDAKRDEEAAATTAGKVQKELSNLATAFQATAYAVQGDLKDSVRRIDSEEAIILKTCQTKIVGIATAIGDTVSRENQDVMNLLNGEFQGLLASLRAMFTPIEFFVKASSEDVGFPGIRKIALDNTNQAGKDLSAVEDKVKNMQKGP